MTDLTAPRKAEVFKFLDGLRASGKINMFMAPSEIQKQFKVDKDESFELFEDWTRNFKD